MDNIKIADLMRHYNKLIQRFQKAEEFFASDIPLKEKLKFETQTTTLVTDITITANKIKQLGYLISNDEYLNGFRQIELIPLS